MRVSSFSYLFPFSSFRSFILRLNRPFGVSHLVRKNKISSGGWKEGWRRQNSSSMWKSFLTFRNNLEPLTQIRNKCCWLDIGRRWMCVIFYTLTEKIGKYFPRGEFSLHNTNFLSIICKERNLFCLHSFFYCAEWWFNVALGNLLNGILSTLLRKEEGRSFWSFPLSIYTRI